VGTTVGVRGGDTAGRTPWDVPVVLHVGRPELLRVRRVSIGLTLPMGSRPGTHVWAAIAHGSTGPRSATHPRLTGGGVGLLAAIAPDLAGIERAWPGVRRDVEPAGEDCSLAELLRDVRSGHELPTGPDVPAGAGDDAGAHRTIDPAAFPPVRVLVAGTELQHRVLAALTRVPVGTTVTYAQLAAAAGAPRAVRAAARTMAVNRVPLVLPCHRVVPSTGGIGRYAWGTPVKAALLAAEGRGSSSARAGRVTPTAGAAA